MQKLRCKKMRNERNRQITMEETFGGGSTKCCSAVDDDNDTRQPHRSVVLACWNNKHTRAHTHTKFPI